MLTNLAAAAATCNTGSWAQQWQCKWNAGWNAPPSSSVTRAGFDFGHNVLPVLIMLAFVLLVTRARRRRKAGGREVQPAAKAWKRAKVPTAQR
jgi:hypothetical protein